MNKNYSQNKSTQIYKKKLKDIYINYNNKIKGVTLLVKINKDKFKHQRYEYNNRRAST